VSDRPAAPAGFVPMEGRGPFTTHNGPFLHDPSGEGSNQAFFARARHCNGLGIVHGGMLSTFLDGLLAGAASRAHGGAAVTMHLSIDFLDMARAGEWIVGEGRLTRMARDVAFVEGRVHTAGRPLARATGVFKLMRRRG